MKSGRVKLVLRAQISLRSKMRRSCMRFLHVNKIPILIYTHTDEHRYYKRLNNREHYKSKTICLPPIYSLCTYLQHAHTRTRTHTPTHPPIGCIVMQTIVWPSIYGFRLSSVVLQNFSYCTNKY